MHVGEALTGEKKSLYMNLFMVSSIFSKSLFGSFGENHLYASIFTTSVSYCFREENISIENCL